MWSDLNGWRNDIFSSYNRFRSFSDPRQGHALHCWGGCGLVVFSYRMTVQERIQLSRRCSAGQLCYSCMNLLESKAFLAFSIISSVQWLYMFSVVVTSA